MTIALLKEGIFEGNSFTKRFGTLGGQKSVFGVFVILGHRQFYTFLTFRAFLFSYMVLSAILIASGKDEP